MNMQIPDEYDAGWIFLGSTLLHTQEPILYIDSYGMVLYGFYDTVDKWQHGFEDDIAVLNP